jgi:hypothetical protein
MNHRVSFTKGATVMAAIASVAAIAALALGTPAHAAENAPRSIELAADGSAAIDIDATAAPDPSADHDLEALALAAPAIESSSQGGVFDLSAAIAAGARMEVATEWAEGVALAGGRVVNVPAGVSLATPTALPPTPRACRGQNKIWTDYLGGHARFSSCVVPKLIAALQAGVGATALAATIATAASMGVGAVSAIVPAVMQYSVWSIDACSKNGTGVELAFAGFICWAQ